uniref:Zn(2)-C6 fungal-type domain-containing protein n=2 Tax=Bionectria ochroleuca TaxID=29856 RepID=A0A0B7KDA7_BIOOC
MDQSGPRHFRRPNGRPAACDPCRARKVACDHTRPICKRCLRGRQGGSKCVYSESALPSSSVSTSPAQQVASARPKPAFKVAPPGIRRPQRRRAPVRRGYLGFTSFSSVLEETVQSLSMVNGSTPDYSQHTAGPRVVQGEVRFSDLPLPLQEMAMYVLSCLPGQPNAHMAFNKTPHKIQDHFYLGVDRVSESVTEIFATLAKHDERATLEAVAEFLCANTALPLPDVHTSAIDHIEQFTGQNLRWESLGLLWAHLERVGDLINAMRTRRVVWLDDRPDHEASQTCLTYCVELSKYFSAGNDLLLDISRRQGTLLSIFDGDANLSCAYVTGATASMLSYLGLHVLKNPDGYQPSSCSENKRRLFAQVFSGDKLSVAFTGRPPLISRRYCSTSLLLDLPDEVLSLDQETITRAAESLDSKGWNTDGAVYSATVIRARYICAVVRDELLEMALVPDQDIPREQILAVREKQIAVFADFPPALHFYPSNLADASVATPVLHSRLMIKLEHLQNLFFADRLLRLSPSSHDMGDIVLTSFDLLSVALLFWTHKDRFAATSQHFEWLVIAYAVPAGGILCQELLQPSFNGTHPSDPRVSRSSIVQKLSLLVGFLDWVHPSAANGDMCVDCKVIIERVLNEHLNAAERVESDGPGWLAKEMEWEGFQTQLDFNLELLDTFDWLRTDGS